MIKTIILAPGAVAAGTAIPVPAPLREGKKITRILSATIIRWNLSIDFTGTTYTFNISTIDVTGEASTDGSSITLANTATTDTDLLVLVVELDYEPGVTE